MRVMFINNDGGGFAERIELTEGTTVGQFFDQRMHGSPQDYCIRVNRQPTDRQACLREGDVISITPTKIDGALYGEKG